MLQSRRERLAGAILLAFAVVWSVGVYWTIPGDPGGFRIGPRGFPLAMGIALAVLAALLIVRGFLADPLHAETAEPPMDRGEWFALAATFGFLSCYVGLLAAIGFVMATVFSTALFMIYVLGKRSVPLVAGMSLGLGFGIWLILGKAMGVYLPRGIYFDWF